MLGATPREPCYPTGSRSCPVDAELDDQEVALDVEQGGRLELCTHEVRVQAE